MASNDPQDYIDPIIRAIADYHQRQQEKANLSEKTRASKAEEAARTHQLDLQEAQSKRALDLQQQAHDLAKQHYDLLAQKEHFDRLVQAGQAAQSGVLRPSGGPPPGQVPTVLNQNQGQSFNIPGVGDIPANQFDSPEAANARTLMLKAQESMAARKAMEDQLNFTNQLPPSQKDIADNASRERIAGMQVAGRSEVAGTQSSGALERAQIAAYARLAGANQGLNETASEGLRTSFATGQSAPNLTNKTHQAIAGPLIAAGYQIGKPWQDTVAQLRELQQLGPILDRFQSFTDLLSKSKLGALGTGMITNSPLSTEIKTKQKEIRSDLFNVAKRLEGIKGSRQVMGIVKLEEGAMPDASDLQKYGQDKVKELRDRWKQATDFLLKGVPPAQLEDLKSAGFDLPSAPVASNPDGRKPLGDIFGGR